MTTLDEIYQNYLKENSYVEDVTNNQIVDEDITIDDMKKVSYADYVTSSMYRVVRESVDKLKELGYDNNLELVDFIMNTTDFEEDVIDWIYNR